jgi:hypothetical protein
MMPRQCLIHSMVERCDLSNVMQTRRRMVLQRRRPEQLWIEYGLKTPNSIFDSVNLEQLALSS